MNHEAAFLNAEPQSRRGLGACGGRVPVKAAQGGRQGFGRSALVGVQSPNEGENGPPTDIVQTTHVRSGWYLNLLSISTMAELQVPSGGMAGNEVAHAGFRQIGT